VDHFRHQSLLAAPPAQRALGQIQIVGDLRNAAVTNGAEPNRLGLEQRGLEL